MNFPEVKSAVKHLVKTSTCIHCNGRYKSTDINVVATTNNEGLFDLFCQGCQASTIVTVTYTPEIEITKSNGDRQHRQISQDDILDIKNFLISFDGDFKKVFNDPQ